MLVQCLIGCLVAVLGMLLLFGLVRFVANAVIMLVALSACGFVIYSIATGIWAGWSQTIVCSLATGAGAALLSLPVLPFSRIGKKK